MKLEDRLKLLEPAPSSDALRTRIAHPSPSPLRAVRYVPLAAAAAALLAVFIFALTQAPPGKTPSTAFAEEEFRKVEDTLMTARSLRVDVIRTATLAAFGTTPAEKVKTIVHISARNGNQLMVSLQETRNADKPGAQGATFLFQSDGKTMQTLVQHGDQLKRVGEAKPAPADLQRRFALTLARQSVATFGNLIALTFDELKKSCDVSEIRPGPDEGDYKVLSYRVGPFDAKLLYDPKTHLPAQRTLENKELGSFKESYGCDVDVPLDDSLFILRQEK